MADDNEQMRVLTFDKQRRAPGPFLFPHQDDPSRPIPKVNNALDRALKASGVRRFRLYDLRHTFATRAAMAGVDLVTFTAILGHSRIQMVLRYAHPTEEHQASAMKRAEQFNATKQMAEYDRLAGAGSIRCPTRCYYNSYSSGECDRASMEVVQKIGGAGRNRTDV